jgi:hypothetical protein
VFNVVSDILFSSMIDYFIVSSRRIWEVLASMSSCRSLGSLFNSSDRVVYFFIYFPS